MSLIIDWLFPRNCFGCGKGEKYLCSLCESKIISGSLTKKDGFEGLISIYKYDDLMKKIVEKIKYEFISDAIDDMAEYMAKKIKLDYPNILKYWQKNNFCLIPIPLFWQRKNWRGFNQSELLTKKLALILNLRYEKEILFRNIKTRNQATIKNRQIRGKNIKEVFLVKEDVKMPRNVILVDDVITSGATMTEALKTLKKSRAVQVWGLSLCGVQR